MELFISDLVKYKRMGELEELGQFLTKDTRIDIKVMCIFFQFCASFENILFVGEVR